MLGAGSSKIKKLKVAERKDGIIREFGMIGTQRVVEVSTKFHCRQRSPIADTEDKLCEVNSLYHVNKL